MLPAFRFFVGGPLGNGKQWVSWLHIDDIVGIYLHAIDNKKLNGAVNAASLSPCKNERVCKNSWKSIRIALPLFPVPKFVLKLVVGEAAEVVTASQRINVNKTFKEWL